MRKIILIIVFINSIVLADWEAVYSPVNMFIYSVSFTNNSTGYIGTQAGMIYKTTNGGQNWTFQQLAGLGGYDINEIFINPINNNHVYAAGNDGSFHKTTNGGANWSFVDLGSSHLRIVVFFDLLHGITASYGNQMFITSNGGNSWNTVSTGILTENYWSSFSAGNAVYVSASGGKIIKSTNAGVNWVIQSINEDALVFSLYFKDANTGYAGTDGGKVYQTTNGGTNWFLLSVLNPAISIHSIVSNGADIFLCGNAGCIFKRPAGSSTWYQQVSNYSSSFFDLCFTDEFTGYAVGNNGTIRKTTNSGDPIGIEPVSGNTAVRYTLFQNYPNPFNPVTNIEFSIPQRTYVKLIIYDNLGREVVTLVNEELPAGNYKTDLNANSLSGGIYYYRMITRDYTDTKKMVLVK